VAEKFSTNWPIRQTGPAGQENSEIDGLGKCLLFEIKNSFCGLLGKLYEY
jgi:hypothetical protein